MKKIPIAFVLVDAEVDRVKDILRKIREIENVAEAYTVAGERDIILKAEADGFKEVAEAVTKQVHKIEGIEDTMTFFAFE